MSNEEDSYTFVVEWYDSVADLNRKYNLRYWPKDSSLSMYDVSKNRLFLKRVVNKDIKFPNDLYIDRTIVVYSRQLKVIDYADKFTQNKFTQISKQYDILFFGIKSFTQFLSKINASFDFKNIKSVRSNEQINQYFNIKRPNEMLIMCEFVGSDDIAKTFNECSADNDFEGLICNENNENNEILMKYINSVSTSAKLNEKDMSTLCLIKPHALSSTSSIINDILCEGFDITAITTKNLTLSQAKDFYEIYNGVVKEYSHLIEQLLSGSVIALQINCGSVCNDKDENNQFTEFREFVGPKDPEIAKYIRPHTLRAKYGVNRVQNGMHCTDLKEDGHLESKFFFEILA